MNIRDAGHFKLGDHLGIHCNDPFVCCENAFQTGSKYEVAGVQRRFVHLNMEEREEGKEHAFAKINPTDFLVCLL